MNKIALEVEREVLKTVVCSHLTRHGSRKALAARIGVSQPRVSMYLEDPSVLSPQTFVRLVEALECSEVDRHFLLTSYNTARRARTPPQSDALNVSILSEQLEDSGIAMAIARLWNMRDQAHYASSPDRARSDYLAIRDATTVLLQRVNTQDWLSLAQLSLLRYHVQSALGRPGDALRYLQNARIRLETRWDDLRSNVAKCQMGEQLAAIVEAEAQAYYNLGQRKESGLGLARAEKITRDISKIEGKPRFMGWLYSTKIGHLARFGPHVGEAENRHDDVKAECLRDIGPERGRQELLVLADIALARVYIRNHSWKGKIRRLLDSRRDEIEHAAYVGPLHRVMFYRTYASYRREIGDKASSADYIRHAVAIATAADLDHQLQQIRVEYGDVLTED